MLVRDKILRHLVKVGVELTGAEIARALNMSNGQVAGHLSHMESQGLAKRNRTGDGYPDTWEPTGNKDKNYAEVTYIGNQNYRIYLSNGFNKWQCGNDLVDILRNAVPELKYARLFTEMVRVPVKRNVLVDIRRQKEKGESNA